MYKNICQLAWITTDVERAVEIFQQEQGIENFGVYRNFELEVPGGPPLVIDVGLCYVGDMQFEIIQPVSGPIELYTRHLPTAGEFALKFHHVCSELESEQEYESVFASFRDRGTAIEIDGHLSGGGRFGYVDTRGSVDHYQEYVVLDDEAREFMATLPRN